MTTVQTRVCPALLLSLIASGGCQPRSRLKEISVPEAGFAVKLPGSPETETINADGAEVKVLRVEYEGGSFSVQCREGPKLTNPTKDELQRYFAQWLTNVMEDPDVKIKEDRDAPLADDPGHF